MSEQLLPCPFCGGEAKLEDAFYDCNHYWAQCQVCKSGTWSHEENPELAIEAWNRRAPVVPSEVRAAIETIVDDCSLNWDKDTEGWQEELVVLRAWLDTLEAHDGLA